MDWQKEIWQFLADAIVLIVVIASSVWIIKGLILDTITDQLKEQTKLLELIANDLSSISSDIGSIETDISSLEENISRVYSRDDIH